MELRANFAQCADGGVLRGGCAFFPAFAVLVLYGCKRLMIKFHFCSWGKSGRNDDAITEDFSF